MPNENAANPEPTTSTEPEKVMYRGVDLSSVFQEEPADAPKVEAQDEPGPDQEVTLPPETPPPENNEEAKPSNTKPFLELTRLRQKLERDRREFETQRKTLDEERQTTASLEKSLKDDPIGTLAKLNLPYEKLTELIVSGKRPQEANPQSAEIQALKENQARLEAALKERDAKAQSEKDAVEVASFKAKLFESLAKGAEEFELINALGEQQMVLDVITAHAKETGDLPDIQEVATKVEEYLAQKLELGLKTKKLSAKVDGAAQQGSGRPSAKRGQLAPRTLTNASVTAAADASKPKTREELLRDAAKLIRFTD